MVFALIICLFQLNHILIVAGATSATIYSHGDEIYILLLVLGVLGAIGGAVSLFIDCTGKRSKALACLVNHYFMRSCFSQWYDLHQCC